jgi:hypothetical protein
MLIGAVPAALAQAGGAGGGADGARGAGGAAGSAGGTGTAGGNAGSSTGNSSVTSPGTGSSIPGTAGNANGNSTSNLGNANHTQLLGFRNGHRWRLGQFAEFEFVEFDCTDQYGLGASAGCCELNESAARNQRSGCPAALFGLMFRRSIRALAPRLRLRIQPIINILAHHVLGQTVALLNLALELIALTVDLADVVVGQLAPLFLDFALGLLPVSFDPIPIHVFLAPR